MLLDMPFRRLSCQRFDAMLQGAAAMICWQHMRHDAALAFDAATMLIYASARGYITSYNTREWHSHHAVSHHATSSPREMVTHGHTNTSVRLRAVIPYEYHRHRFFIIDAAMPPVAIASSPDDYALFRFSSCRC